MRDEGMRVLFIYFIRHLSFIGVWLSEDQRTNTFETHD